LLGGAHVKGATLAAVCDLVPDRANALSAKYGVPAFTDMHAMMGATALDAVAILTESGSHAEHTLELAPYGKHIIVEKPMALTLDDADAMIRACDRYGAKLFVVKQNRFNVPVVKTRQALEAGRFGKLILGTVRVRWCRRQEYYDQAPWRGTWALDGGVLTNQASHHVDLLEWMMGSVESVHALSSTALADIEAEDTAVAVLRFKNGALGVIEATTATRPADIEGSLSLLGSNGTAVIGGFAVNQLHTWKFETSLPGDDEVLSKYSVNPPSVYGFGHQAYYEHVIDCITNGSPALVDGLEGRRSLELITALYESVETGLPVKLRFTPTRCRLGMRDA
jgi:predicted dehydrogenase